jgi:hypothetical protein
MSEFDKEYEISETMIVVQSVGDQRTRQCIVVLNNKDSTMCRDHIFVVGWRLQDNYYKL